MKSNRAGKEPGIETGRRSRPFFAAPPVFPGDQKNACDEDRGVGSDGDSDQKSQREIVDDFSTEKKQSGDNQQCCS